METPEGAAPEAAPKPPLVARVAVLDHDGVYWPPLEERTLADIKPGELVFGDPALKDSLPAGAVYVDRDCDLDGGKYRWNAERRTFEALPRESRKEAPKAPTLEQAFYDLLVNGPNGQAVSAWRAWMQKSIDGKGAG